MHKYLSLIFLILIFSVINFKCNAERDSSIVVKGNLNGLPSGIIYMYNDQHEVIDSAATKEGLFSFDFNNKTNNQYLYVALEHLDHDGIKRLFQFKTNKLMNGGPYHSQFFILENGIRIEGTLLDFVPKGFNLPSNIKLVYPSEPISNGVQNTMMNNISYNFDVTPTESSITQMKSLITKFPNSYYLLHEIAVHKNIFSATQIRDFLSLFDEDLQTFEEASRLRKSAEIKESNNYSIKRSQLHSPSGELKSIIDNTSSINMIILWASWCRPCLAEIPDLTRVFNKFNTHPGFHMVSVSLDAEKDEWQKALKKYDMPWQQLWLQKSLSSYGTEIFKFDGAIPTIIFVDNEGRLIEKFTGYNKSNLKLYLELIDKHLKVSEN